MAGRGATGRQLAAGEVGKVRGELARYQEFATLSEQIVEVNDAIYEVRPALAALALSLARHVRRIRRGRCWLQDGACDREQAHQDRQGSLNYGTSPQLTGLDRHGRGPRR